MSDSRRSPQQQQLRWTGERYVPWVEDAALHYEHLHRYFFASAYVASKDVLDMASGEGYGSSILAQEARSVLGVDNDPAAVLHAARRYGDERTSFLTASILDVGLADRSFDAIVCFEAVEHVGDHERLLSEIDRLLRPGGLLFLSTPNREVYAEENEAENPFHVKELNLGELEGLLESRFSHVAVYGQHVVPGSYLFVGGAPPASAEVELIERAEVGFRRLDRNASTMRYFVAVASKEPLPRLPQSMLLDLSRAKFSEGRVARRHVGELERQITERGRALERMEQHQLGLESDLTRLEERYRQLQSTAEERQRGLESADADVADAKRYVAELQALVDRLERQVRETGEVHARQSQAFEELEQDHGDVTRTFTELDAGHRNLEANYRTLEADYRTLEEGYRILEGGYRKLEAAHEQLQAERRRR